MDKYIHVAIKDLLSNPFRRIEHYPIRREKVEALKESIQRTGFWDNLLVRPAGKGKFERAFGEHRDAALREHFKDPDHKVGVIVREISDEDMIRIMARENMEEWGKTSGIVEIETVHSVVLAYAAGIIALEPAAETGGRIRYAPSFSENQGKTVSKRLCSEKPYTSASIAKFLGWSQHEKVADILSALQFIVEEHVLSYSDFAELSTTQAKVVIHQARKQYLDNIKAAKASEKEAEEASKEAERASKEEARAKTAADKAKAAQVRASAQTRKAALEASAQTSRRRAKEVTTKVGRGVSEALRTGTKGYREAPDIADEIVYGGNNQKRELPSAEKFVKKLAWNIYEILKPKFDSRTERLEAIIESRDEIDPGKLKSLALTLVELSRRSMEYANRLAPSGNAVKFVAGLDESRLLEDVK